MGSYNIQGSPDDHWDNHDRHEHPLLLFTLDIKLRSPVHEVVRQLESALSPLPSRECHIYLNSVSTRGQSSGWTSHVSASVAATSSR